MKLYSDIERNEITSEIINDVKKEVTFLQEIGEIKVDKELEAMIRIYNDNLTKLSILRFDAEVWRALLNLETSNKELESRVLSNDRELQKLRIIIEVIRSQITLLVDAANTGVTSIV